MEKYKKKYIGSTIISIILHIFVVVVAGMAIKYRFDNNIDQVLNLQNYASIGLLGMLIIYIYQIVITAKSGKTLELSRFNKFMIYFGFLIGLFIVGPIFTEIVKKSNPAISGIAGTIAFMLFDIIRYIFTIAKINKLK
jgi:hypothetical protein